MTNPLPEGAPWWASLIAYALIAVAGYAAVVKGWKGASKPEAEAAIVMGDIMATKPMADLARAVETLNDRVRLNTEAQDRAAAASDRAIAAQDRTQDAIRDLCREIQRSRE